MTGHDGDAQGYADRTAGVVVDGATYYSLQAPAGTNPCAGQPNHVPCPSMPPGCICLNGQCYFTLERLQEMGVKLD